MDVPDDDSLLMNKQSTEKFGFEVSINIRNVYDNLNLSITKWQSLRNEPSNNQVDEHLLASWLTRIYPDIDDKQPNPEHEPINALDMHRVVAHQVIVFGGTSRRSNISGSVTANNAPADRALSHGCASWMSLSTLSAPVVAVAGSSTHSAWCNHTDATVEIFKPRRFV